MMHALLGLDSMPLLAQEASATYLRYITGGGVVGYVILGLSVIAVALGLAQLVHVRAGRRSWCRGPRRVGHPSVG